MVSPASQRNSHLPLFMLSLLPPLYSVQLVLSLSEPTLELPLQGSHPITLPLAPIMPCTHLCHCPSHDGMRKPSYYLQGSRPITLPLAPIMPCTHLCHCPSHDGIIICTYVCGPLENRDYLQFIPLPSTPPLPPVWSRGPSILKVLGFLNQLFDEQWTRVVVGEDQGGVFLSRPADKPQPHRPLYFLHSGTQLG